MKIKLVVLEKDASYLERIVSVFHMKYADKLEVYSFTELDAAMEKVLKTKVNVFLASDTFEVDVDVLPDYCGFAYFVDSQNVEGYKDQYAICKFQKADLIYKQILSIYSEKISFVTSSNFENSDTETILFTSASGGVGSSTLAAACAKMGAMRGKRVLYLNLEAFGNADLFFHGEGQFHFGDVIYALKSKKMNMGLKLESDVKQDASGVYFYSAPQVALDMMELTVEDVKRLLVEIRMTGAFDLVVLDADFDLSKMGMMMWENANKVVMVSDGSENANGKFERMYDALQILAQQDESIRMEKMMLIYNKFSNKTSKMITGIEVENIGGIQRYEHAMNEQIVNQIATMGIMEKILQ